MKFGRRIWQLWLEPQKKERITYHLNGDQIKYNSNGEIEWRFSPRYGWSELPDNRVKELTEHDLEWDFFSSLLLAFEELMRRHGRLQK
jgi:hypothetical protein